MMHKIGNVVFSNPRKSSFVRIMRLTTTPSRGIMRVFDRFSSKIADEAERKDIETLEKFTELTKYFREFNIPFDHPINNVAEKIRALRSLNELSSDMKDVQLALDNYKAFVVAQELPIRAEIEASTKIVVPAESDGVVETNDDDIQLKWQTSMRLRLLNHYIHYLKVAVQEGDIAVNMINPDSMNRIIDSFLLGTSSERLQEHMKLYSPQFTNQQLQDCFYTLYNSEVECVSLIFSEIKDKHKQHKKGMEKYAKNYLLDNLEVNTKSRCVFAWSDPLFTGFKPLPDEHVIPLSELLPSRRKYFKEGTTVAHSLMISYTGERRMFYTDKKDTNETFRMGFAFLVGTIILDWAICMM